jgi:ATP-dependent RNA helicase DDX52/ROK1
MCVCVCVCLSSVRLLVFDEADKLWEMGFLEQVDGIVSACTHPKVQRALFSATMLPVVEDLAKTVLRDPIRVLVGAK